LRGVNWRLTAHIQNVYTELTLAALTEYFQAGTRPVVAQQIEAQLLKIIIVGRDRKPL
jgi:hypothetical protein